jgi:uncharacterized protein
MTSDKTARPRALITGASSGLGLAFALRLAQEPYDLTLVARRKDRLESVANQLMESYDINVRTVAADLTESGDLRSVEALTASDASLELLINNAGFGAYGPFREVDPDVAEEMIRLHVVALTRLTRAALPAMIDRGHGDIINVSSILAFSASRPNLKAPGRRAMYAATKAYINAFTQLVYHEIDGTGVRIQSLCPGMVPTEFHGRMSEAPPVIPPMAAADVVEASLLGLSRGEVICAPPVEDAELIEQWQEAEQRINDFARMNSLASRYRN